MKTVIKYCAILFALMLAGSIISGCVNAGVMIVRAIAEKDAGKIRIDGEVVFDVNDLVEEGAFEKVDGGIKFFGIQFGGTRETKSGTYEVTGMVQEIRLDGVPGEVEIKRGDTFCVTYQNIPVEYRMEVRDGKLILEDESKGVFVIGINVTEKPYLCLTIPESVELTKLFVDNGSGKLTVTDIRSKDLELDGGSGSMSVVNAKAENLSVDGGSGTVRFTNVASEVCSVDMGSGGLRVKNSTLGNTRLHSGSGSCIFEEVSAYNLVANSGSGKIVYQGELSGNCIFDSGSGSVRLDISGKREDFSIRADIGSGGFYIDGKKEGRNSGSYVLLNDGAHSLVFDSGSGSVSIDFSE